MTRLMTSNSKLLISDCFPLGSVLWSGYDEGTESNCIITINRYFPDNTCRIPREFAEILIASGYQQYLTEIYDSRGSTTYRINGAWYSQDVLTADVEFHPSNENAMHVLKDMQ